MLPNLKIGNLTAKYPIIQGGMGVGISLSSLAGAVAKAGGIGVISAAQPGWRDPPSTSAVPKKSQTAASSASISCAP